MEQLYKLECHKRNPPGWESCILEVQFHYSNGDMDAIGTPEGGNSHVIQGDFSHPGWYYYKTDDLYALFACYVDESLLPSVGSGVNK